MDSEEKSRFGGNVASNLADDDNCAKPDDGAFMIPSMQSQSAPACVPPAANRSILSGPAGCCCSRVTLDQRETPMSKVPGSAPSFRKATISSAYAAKVGPDPPCQGESQPN